MMLVMPLLKPTRSVWNGKEINLSSEDISIVSDTLNIDKSGKMVLKSTPTQGQPSITIINPNQETTYADFTSGVLRGYGDGTLHTQFYYNIGQLLLVSKSGGGVIHNYSASYYRDDISNMEDLIAINNDGAGEILCVKLTQTSKEEQKKNFEKLENALDIVKATDIYKYNFKSQKDDSKKHIGFVIGDNYNYSEEITSERNDGADIYSMVSVCFKAIQEQQEQIEKLQQEIKELKGEK